MENLINDSIEMKLRDQTRIGHALALGVQAAFDRHRKLGERVAVGSNGKPALVTVEEALAMADAAKQASA